MRRAAPLVAALLAGLAAAAAAGVLLRAGGTGPEVTPRTPTRLSSLPAGPADVVIRTVRLGTGFRSHHHHGGPTINLVRSGVVEIDDPASGRLTYRAGDTFVEPADRDHTIRIRSAARIDVVRILPLGAAATTEVPDGGPGD